jgi:regulator of protease activity HflC (stomatin/prohibitin superfamily)
MMIIVGLLMGVLTAAAWWLASMVRGRGPVPVRRLAAVAAAWLAFGLAAAAVRIVPAGHVGVLDLFGRISPQPLASGLHLVNPLRQVHRMDIRTQEVKETADSPSQEGLNIHLEVSLWLQVIPEQAPEVYRTIGTDYLQKIVIPSFRSALRNTTARHEAKALYTGARELIAEEVQGTLKPLLKARGIEVQSVMLRKVELPPRVAEAVNQKLAAEQEAERMKFVLQKERLEAERKAIEAEGIAQFQRIVSQGITPTYLEWKGIEATLKLAESANAKTVVVGNPKNGLPLILSGQ